MPGSNSRPNVSEGYEVPTELPGSTGVAGTKTAQYCAQHAKNGMIYVKRSKCRTKGCGKGPSFGVAGTRTAEYCAHNIRPRCDVEGYMRRETGSHHFGEQTIGNASQSDVKRKISPCQASPLSGGIEGACKRVRHLDIASTPLKRAGARGSAAQAVTMPGIDGQKASARQNPPVKTEVQVFLSTGKLSRDRKPIWFRYSYLCLERFRRLVLILCFFYICSS